MDELKKKLATLTALPKKKYAFPMTTNQVIGWETDEVNFFVKYPIFQYSEAFRPKYPYNKGSCSETKYASDYVAMTKRSPYAKKTDS